MNDATTRAAKLALGVPHEADPAMVRTAFLRQLRDHGFTPPPLAVEAAVALALITPAPTPPPMHLLRRMERDLANAIAIFAKHYWDLTPDERRDAWRALADQATPWPRQVARLDMLRDGLSLTPPTLSDSLQAELVAVIQELYPKPAAEQTELWFAYLSKRSDDEAWFAARSVHREHPTFANLLEPQLSYLLPKPKGPVYRRIVAALTGMHPRVVALLLVGVCILLGALASTRDTTERRLLNQTPSTSSVQLPKGTSDEAVQNLARILLTVRRVTKQEPPTPSVPPMPEQLVKDGLSKLWQSVDSPSYVQTVAKRLWHKKGAEMKLSDLEKRFLEAAQSAEYTVSFDVKALAKEILAKEPE